MDVDAYLDRIGAARPPAATASALRDLHEAHLAAVPFENLSIHPASRSRSTRTPCSTRS
jgi:N-hydroxyarylamine O-acetyltransferase